MNKVTLFHQEVFEYWNSKRITVHKRLTSDIALKIGRSLKDYSVEEIKAGIDFYHTILEPGVKESEKQYWWTYKWGLADFLARGLPKFDGQSVDNYKKRQQVASPEAIVFKRD